MKNIKFLGIAFLVLSMGFVSCSSDNDEDWSTNLTEADIIGLWEHVETTYLVNGKVVFYEDQSDLAPCDSFTLDFKTDNTVIVTSTYGWDGECYSNINEEPWELEGNTIRWFEEDGEYVNESQVRRKGDYMIFSESEIIDEAFIENFFYSHGEISYKFVVGEEVFFEGTLRKK